MKSSSCRIVVFTMSTVAIAGCHASEMENPFGVDEIEGRFDVAGYIKPDEVPGGTNHLDPDCFWDHGTQEGLRLLGTKGLDDSGNGELQKLPSVKLHCRDIIESAVMCALDQSKVLVDPDTGNKYQGWWGLAPSWERDPIASKEGAWVSSCIMQRLNAYGQTVRILLEGDNTPIEEDKAADTDFPFEESTIFGNIFTSKAPLYTNRPAFNAFVCAEEGVVQACGHKVDAALDTRICENARAAGICGLTYIGECKTACVPNGPYWACNYMGTQLDIGVRVQVEYNPHPVNVCP